MATLTTLEAEVAAVAESPCHSVGTQDGVTESAATSTPTTTTSPATSLKVETKESSPPAAAAKSKISRHASSKASETQHRTLLSLYISHFCKNFRKFRRMKSLNAVVETLAAQHHYTDLGHFHHDYFSRYMEMVGHSAYVEERVRDEVAKFSWASWHWWGRCVRLSMQSRRRGMVKMVVEELGSGGFENKAFQVMVEEFVRES